MAKLAFRPFIAMTSLVEYTEDGLWIYTKWDLLDLNRLKQLCFLFLPFLGVSLLLGFLFAFLLLC